MKEQVAIVGIGMTDCRATPELSHQELLYTATKKALVDAGISKEDIGGTITASIDFLEGRTLSNQYTIDASGGVMRSSDMRMVENGIYALIAGYMEVAADPSKFLMVSCVQKASERRGEKALNRFYLSCLEPIFYRPLFKAFSEFESVANMLAAMEARQYMEKFDISTKQLAQVVVKNLGNAIENHHANFGRKVTVEEVLQSDTIADPLTSLEISKPTDGACALVLAPREMINTLRVEPVWIYGLGWCSGTAFIENRDLSRADYTQKAAKQAYEMAGVKEPTTEIHVAEVYDSYAYKELQHCEALGFCPEGTAGRMLEEGAWEKDGRLPVNPSGGLLGEGNPILAGGLYRAAHAAKQVKGDAGPYQIANVERAVAQAWNEMPTHSGAVVVLGH
jgi:acetyl-CoA C-acetyltransferase